MVRVEDAMMADLVEARRALDAASLALLAEAEAEILAGRTVLRILYQAYLYVHQCAYLYLECACT